MRIHCSFIHILWIIYEYKNESVYMELIYKTVIWFS